MNLLNTRFWIILFILFVNSSSIYAQCTGTIRLSTQDEIDSFNCTEVTGTIFIQGADITNLNGLSGLTSIEGDLNIIFNTALTNIDGLSGLTFVGGSLLISSNAALTNIDGLSTLTSIEGNLSIFDNAALTDIDGLSGLTSIDGVLSIDNNGVLTNIDGLSGLTSIEGFLSINKNGVLTNIDGLSGLTSVGGSLSIVRNAALTNIDGLSGLTFVGDGLSITRNAALTDIDGLSRLTSIEGDLNISDNAALTDIDGLSRLTSIEGFLEIQNNPTLINIDGLSGLTSIQRFLRINLNTILTKIDGLSALSSVGEDLFIQGNPTLVNIDGLSGLTFVGENLNIQNNRQLSECCVLSNLFSNGTIEGTILMFSNADNCNNDGADIMNNCVGTIQDTDNDNFTIAQGDCNDNDPTIYPGAPEICENGIDENCDGIDDICPDPCNMDFIFTSQAEVNAFDPTCETIQGNCIIRGADITDLSPLAGITEITGNVTIGSSDGTLSNELLTSLEGLSGLVTITGRLSIVNCAVLTSVEGLSALETIGGVTIRNCPQLQAIFFPVLVSVGGNCNYISLPQVTVIGNPNGGGTGGIQSLGGGIIFDDVPMLTDINGLANLTSLGGDLFIIGASNLTNVAAFVTLISIDGCVHLINNPLLTDLSGLATLETVGGNIRVVANSAITDINNFTGVTEIGGSLFLDGNTNLTDLTGLSDVINIGDTLMITNNPLLATCCSVNDLLQNGGVQGTVIIENNLSGCNSVDEINDNCTDGDGDGFVLKDDCDDNDPNIGAKQTPGTSCGNGIIQANGCTCAGEVPPPLCENNGGDADGDGICANEDCNDNDPNIGANQPQGTACNDNNDLTNNDVILADGCTCQGTIIQMPTFVDECNLEDGLISYHTFSGNNEDITRQGHNATSSGNPQSISDRFGNLNSAISMNGDDGVNITENLADYRFNNTSLTMSAWVTLADNNNDYEGYVSIGNNSVGIDLYKRRAGLPDGNIAYLHRVGNSLNITNSILPGEEQPLNTWLHLVGVTDVDSNLIKLYINGELQDRTPLTLSFDYTNITDFQVVFGQRAGISSFNQDGNIDDVRIYNRALSESEIQKLYDCGQPVNLCANNGVDSDNDGICDDTDNCPQTPNPNQLNADNDTAGAACDCDDSPETGASCTDGCQVFYRDMDEDGFGNAMDSVMTCVAPTGYVDNKIDCDDGDSNIPTAVGSSCNDNNANTDNDVILADGCTCEGIPIDCTVPIIQTTQISSGDNQTFVLFENDFENPTTTDFTICTPGLSQTPVRDVFGLEFNQTFTVETVLFNTDDTQFSDPQGIGGNYSLGMLSGLQNDMLAFTFDTRNLPFLNLEMDISELDIIGCGADFSTERPVFRITAYDTPSANFAFTNPGTILNSTDLMGIDGGATPQTVNWTTVEATLDVASASSNTVTIVLDLMEGGYAAFDNITITASNVAGSTGNTINAQACETASLIGTLITEENSILTTSFGTIIQNSNNWTWTSPELQADDSQTVTITATNDCGMDEISFELIVEGEDCLVTECDFSDGLAAYYPLNGNANDQSGNNINGTENGGAIYGEDRFGNAGQSLNLVGNNGYVDFGDALDIGTNDFAISLWFNANTIRATGFGTKILNKGLTVNGTPSNAGYGLRVIEEGGENVLRFFGRGAVDTVGIEEKVWYHVFAQRRGTSVLLYVNGELVGQIEEDPIVNSDTNIPLALGALHRGQFGQTTEFFDGSIDDFRFYLNRPFSDDEVSELYQCEKGDTAPIPPCNDLLTTQTFTTQSQLDSFVCDCNKTIQGDLIINGDNITDLSNLSCIKEVTGNVLIGDSLDVFSNDILETLNGLSGVMRIGGDLVICNNPALRNLDGFSNLMEVGGDIQVKNCLVIEYIRFVSLTSVGGSCIYLNLPTLRYIGSASFGVFGGFGLTSFGGGVRYENLPELIWITGFGGLSEIRGDIYFVNVPKLESLEAYQSIIRLFGCLHLIQTTQIVDFAGLDSLELIGEDIRIINNDQIRDLSQLGNLVTLNGSLIIRDNDNLIDLNGLRNLASIADSLVIMDNPRLNDCCGIDALLQNEGVNGTVMIAENLEGCLSPENINETCQETPPVATCDFTDPLLDLRFLADIVANPDPCYLEIRQGVLDGEPIFIVINQNICEIEPGVTLATEIDYFILDCQGANICTAGFVDAPVGCRDISIEGITLWEPDTTGTVCSPDTPVCGSNGITYANRCEAEAAGVFDYFNGECPIYLDEDGDGFRSNTDCDDTNPNIFPGAPESPCSGVDENCNGIDDSVTSEPCNTDVDCPEFGLNIGQPCDDNDPTTDNEWLEEGCICVGQVIDDCAANISVVGNSIIVENLNYGHNKALLFDRTFSNAIDTTCTFWVDCGGTQSFENLLPGVYAVQIQTFSEDWSKLHCDFVEYVEITGNTNTDACADLGVTLNGNDLSITELPTLNTIIDLFDNRYAAVFRCVGDCGTGQVVENLLEGSYFLRVKVYDNDWNFLCEIEENLEVTGTSIITTDDRSNLSEIPNTSAATSKLKIYPNPSSEQIQVKMEDFMNLEVDLMITDILGRRVYQQHFDKVDNFINTIDIHLFDAGVYHVSVNQNGVYTTTKLIVIR